MGEERRLREAAERALEDEACRALEAELRRHEERNCWQERLRAADEAIQEAGRDMALLVMGSGPGTLAPDLQAEYEAVRLRAGHPGAAGLIGPDCPRGVPGCLCGS